MAQIKLTITADTQGVQKSVEQIAKPCLRRHPQSSKHNVNEEPTAQVDPLSRYYEP